jgi:hypothetical protein
MKKQNIYKGYFAIYLIKKMVELDKKSRSVLGISLISLLLIVIGMIFVLGIYQISPISRTMDEDISTRVNITINSTILDSTQNISYLYVTPQDSSVIIDNTTAPVETSAFYESLDSSPGQLLWMNITELGLFSYGTNHSFWFNVTASTPGKHNLSIDTYNSTLGFVNNTNITLTVIDRTAPILSIVYPLTGNAYGVNVSELNYTISDYALDTCTYSVNGGVLNNITIVSCGTNITSIINITEGENIWMMWANESMGNQTVVISKFNITITSIKFNETNTEVNGANKSQGYIIAAVNVSEVNLKNITYILMNSSWAVINYTNFTMGNATGVNSFELFNFTNTTGNLAEGIYHYNVTLLDSKGNTNTTNRTIRLDRTAPSVNLTSPADGATLTAGVINFTYTYLDDINVSNCSLVGLTSIITNTSVQSSSVVTTSQSLTTPGTYTWSVQCKDYAGNTANSSMRTLTVTAATTTTDTTGGTTGGLTPEYITVYSIDSTQLSNGYTRTLDSSSRIRFQIGSAGEYHYFNVTGVGTLTASIVVSSTPQTATMAIGDEKKFELTGDGFYDLYVKLNNISNSKANFTVKSIYEAVSVVNCGNGVIDSGETCASCPADVVCAEGEECINAECSVPGTGLGAETPTGLKTWVWVVIIVVVIVVILLVVMLLMPKKKKYGFK